MEPPWEVGKKVYIDGTGHMTKMATMLIYGKNLQKSNSPMIMKLGVEQYVLKFYNNVYILVNEDPELTLTQISVERLQDHWSSGQRSSLKLLGQSRPNFM